MSVSDPFREALFPHLPRRLLGVVMVVALAVWLPTPLAEFEFAFIQVLALIFIGIGLYELVSSGLVNVLRCAFLITLGVGLQLLALDLITFGELLAVWPLALITFGLIVLLADAIEERKFDRYRHTHR